MPTVVGLGHSFLHFLAGWWVGHGGLIRRKGSLARGALGEPWGVRMCRAVPFFYLRASGCPDLTGVFGEIGKRKGRILFYFQAGKS